MVERTESARTGVAHRVALAALLLFAAHLYFGAVLKTTVEQPIRADAMDYVSYAYNLTHSGVYSRAPTWVPGHEAGLPGPDALRPPGYPLLLAALLGDRVPDGAFVLRVLMLQALLGVGIVALSYVLARLLLSPGRALACAALVALAPHLVTSATYVLTETLFAFLMLLGLLGLALAWREPRRYLAPLLGAALALGLAALVRPTLQYLPLLLCPVLWWLARGARGRTMAFAFALAFGVAFAAWPVRNLVALGRTGDPTLTIGVVHHGSYPGFRYQGRPETYGYPYRFDPESPAIAQSLDSVLAHVLAQFRREPATMLRWYLLQKPFAVFGWEPIQGEGDVFVYPVSASPYLDRVEFRATRALMKALHWPLMLAGLAGALAVWVPAFARRLEPPRRDALRSISVPLGLLVAISVVGAPWPRYSVPFRPLSFLFALVLLEAWRARAAATNRESDQSGRPDTLKGIGPDRI